MHFKKVNKNNPNIQFASDFDWIAISRPTKQPVNSFIFLFLSSCSSPSTPATTERNSIRKQQQHQPKTTYKSRLNMTYGTRSFLSFVQVRMLVVISLVCRMSPVSLKNFIHFQITYTTSANKLEVKKHTLNNFIT